MIFFPAPGGRLGNQMFQIDFIQKERAPGERVLCFQMGYSLQAFDLPRWHNSDSKFLINLWDHVFSYFFRFFLVPCRIVSSIRDNAGTIRRRTGLLRCFTIVEGYFQFMDSPEKPTLPPLRDSGVEQRCRKFWGEHSLGDSAFFVHIRRGDYKDYEILGVVNPILPVSYYQQALQKLRESFPDRLRLVFLGDDQVFMQNLAADYPGSVVSNLGPLEDLYLMSLCSGGIVSNSSFAWWGGRLSQGTPVYAPRFWLGWKSGEWYPEGIQTSSFTYLDIQGSP